MDFMSGCSVNKVCKAGTMTTDSLTAKGYCDGFSILANTCQNDMPKMRGCKNYVSMCAPANSTVRQCRSNIAIPGLPKTDTINKAVRSICTSHTMEGCEKCTYASPTAFGNCDLLAVYSQLCVAMPNMEECSSWKTMCTESPELHSLCGTEATTSPPVMKMFFHNEPTHVLFKSWVPRVAGDYTWSFFLLLIMGITVEGIQSYRPMLERSMTLVNRGNPTIAQKFINGKAYIYYPSLFVLRGVEALLAYLLMLAAMSFNIIIFSAVISGLTIGYIVFLPMKLKLREAHPCCGESDSSSLCC